MEKSGTIKGEIMVYEKNSRNDDFFVADFQIFVFLDDNGNGYTDEFEDMFNISAPDEDGDGLMNYWEWDHFGEYNDYDNDSILDWLDWDSDNDGLPDGYAANISVGEIMLGSHPLDNDTDDDNIIDEFEWFGWEIQIQRDIGEGYISVHTSSNLFIVDTDGDGIDDYQEFLNGTDPNSIDTDFDGVNDSIEYATPLDPNNYDTDGDGLTDAEEYFGFVILSEWGLLITNATVQDTDGDGITDYQEVFGIGEDLKDLYLQIDWELDKFKNLQPPYKKWALKGDYIITEDLILS